MTQALPYRTQKYMKGADDQQQLIMPGYSLRQLGISNARNFDYVRGIQSADFLERTQEASDAILSLYAQSGQGKEVDAVTRMGIDGILAIAFDKDPDEIRRNHSYYAALLTGGQRLEDRSLAEALAKAFQLESTRLSLSRAQNKADKAEEGSELEARWLREAEQLERQMLLQMDYTDRGWLQNNLVNTMPIFAQGLRSTVFTAAGALLMGGLGAVTGIGTGLSGEALSIAGARTLAGNVLAGNVTAGTALGTAGSSLLTAAGGATLGRAADLYYNVYQLERGSLSRDLSKLTDEDGRPMDKEIRTRTAAVAAVLLTAVEVATPEPGLTRFLPGGTNYIIGKTLSSKLKGAGAKWLANAVSGALGESLEEAIQSIISDTAEDVAKLASDRKGVTGFTGGNGLQIALEDYISNAFTSFSQAFFPSLLAGLPGTSAQFFRDVSNRRMTNNNKLFETTPEMEVSSEMFQRMTKEDRAAGARVVDIEALYIDPAKKVSPGFAASAGENADTGSAGGSLFPVIEVTPSDDGYFIPRTQGDYDIARRMLERGAKGIAVKVVKAAVRAETFSAEARGKADATVTADAVKFSTAERLRHEMEVLKENGVLFEEGYDEDGNLSYLVITAEDEDGNDVQKIVTFEDGAEADIARQEADLREEAGAEAQEEMGAALEEEAGEEGTAEASAVGTEGPAAETLWDNTRAVVLEGEAAERAAAETGDGTEARKVSSERAKIILDTDGRASSLERTVKRRDGVVYRTVTKLDGTPSHTYVNALASQIMAAATKTRGKMGQNIAVETRSTETIFGTRGPATPTRTAGGLTIKNAKAFATLLMMMPEDRRDLYVNGVRRLFISDTEVESRTPGTEIKVTAAGWALLDSVQVVLSNTADAATVAEELFHIIGNTEPERYREVAQAFQDARADEASWGQVRAFVEQNIDVFKSLFTSKRYKEEMDTYRWRDDVRSDNDAEVVMRVLESLPTKKTKFSEVQDEVMARIGVRHLSSQSQSEITSLPSAIAWAFKRIGRAIARTVKNMLRHMSGGEELVQLPKGLQDAYNDMFLSEEISGIASGRQIKDYLVDSYDQRKRFSEVETGETIEIDASEDETVTLHEEDDRSVSEEYKRGEISYAMKRTLSARFGEKAVYMEVDPMLPGTENARRLDRQAEKARKAGKLISWTGKGNLAELDGVRCYLGKDGKSGFAVTDRGRLELLFTEESEQAARLSTTYSLYAQAMMAGATHMTVLGKENLYEALRMGFKVAAKGITEVDGKDTECYALVLTQTVPEAVAGFSQSFYNKDFQAYIKEEVRNAEKLNAFNGKKLSRGAVFDYMMEKAYEKRRWYENARSAFGETYTKGLWETLEARTEEASSELKLLRKSDRQLRALLKAGISVPVDILTERYNSPRRTFLFSAPGESDLTYSQLQEKKLFTMIGEEIEFQERVQKLGDRQRKDLDEVMRKHPGGFEKDLMAGYNRDLEKLGQKWYGKSGRKGQSLPESLRGLTMMGENPLDVPSQTARAFWKRYYMMTVQPTAAEVVGKLTSLFTGDLDSDKAVIDLLTQQERKTGGAGRETVTRVPRGGKNGEYVRQALDKYVQKISSPDLAESTKKKALSALRKDIRLNPRQWVSAWMDGTAERAPTRKARVHPFCPDFSYSQIKAIVDLGIAEQDYAEKMRAISEKENAPLSDAEFEALLNTDTGKSTEREARDILAAEGFDADTVESLLSSLKKGQPAEIIKRINKAIKALREQSTQTAAETSRLQAELQGARERNSELKEELQTKQAGLEISAGAADLLMEENRALRETQDILFGDISRLEEDMGEEAKAREAAWKAKLDEAKAEAAEERKKLRRQRDSNARKLTAAESREAAAKKNLALLTEELTETARQLNAVYKTLSRMEKLKAENEENSALVKALKVTMREDERTIKALERQLGRAQERAEQRETQVKEAKQTYEQKLAAMREQTAADLKAIKESREKALENADLIRRIDLSELRFSKNLKIEALRSALRAMTESRENQKARAERWKERDKADIKAEREKAKEQISHVKEVAGESIRQQQEAIRFLGRTLRKTQKELIELDTEYAESMAEAGRRMAALKRAFQTKIDDMECEASLKKALRLRNVKTSYDARIIPAMSYIVQLMHDGHLPEFSDTDMQAVYEEIERLRNSEEDYDIEFYIRDSNGELVENSRWLLSLTGEDFDRNAVPEILAQYLDESLVRKLAEPGEDSQHAKWSEFSVSEKQQILQALKQAKKDAASLKAERDSIARGRREAATRETVNSITRGKLYKLTEEDWTEAETVTGKKRDAEDAGERLTREDVINLKMKNTANWTDEQDKGKARQAADVLFNKVKTIRVFARAMDGKEEGAFYQAFVSKPYQALVRMSSEVKRRKEAFIGMQEEHLGKAGTAERKASDAFLKQEFELRTGQEGMNRNVRKTTGAEILSIYIYAQNHKGFSHLVSFNGDNLGIEEIAGINPEAADRELMLEQRQRELYRMRAEQREEKNAKIAEENLSRDEGHQKSLLKPLEAYRSSLSSISDSRIAELRDRIAEGKAGAKDGITSMVPANIRALGDAMIDAQALETDRYLQAGYETDNVIAPVEKRYMPMHPKQEYSYLGSQKQGGASIRGKGSTFARQDNAKGAIVTDPFSLYISSIEAQENYINLAPVLKDLNWMMGQHGGLKETVERLYGESWGSYLEWYIKALDQGNPTPDEFNSMINKVIGNYAVARLSFNLSTVLKQTLSVIPALTVGKISAGDLAASIAYCSSHGDEVTQLISQYGYGVLEADYNAELTRLRRQREASPAGNAMDKVIDVGTKWMQGVDGALKKWVWYASYAKNLRETGNVGLSAERASMLVQQTQSSTNIFSQSPLMSDMSPWKRMLFLFSNDTFHMWNILFGDAVMDFQEGLTAQGIEKILGVSLTAAAAALLAVPVAGPDDDDYDPGEFDLKGFLQEFAGNGLQYSIPVFGMLAQEMTGGNAVNASPYSTFAKEVYEFVSEFNKADGGIYALTDEGVISQFFDTMAEVGAVTVGFPATALNRARRALVPEDGEKLPYLNPGYFYNYNLGQAWEAWF